MSSLDEALMGALKRKPRAVGAYWPSRLPYCLRQQYYEWRFGVEYPEEKLRLFELGNILHGWVKDKLAKNDMGAKLLASEASIHVYIPPPYDFFIHGRPDDIVLIEAIGQTYVVEVKSHKDLRFLDGPMKEHMLQLNFYLKFYPGAEGRLLYIEKSTLKTREFPIAFNKEQFLALIERAKRLHEALKAMGPQGRSGVGNANSAYSMKNAKTWPKNQIKSKPSRKNQKIRF